MRTWKALEADILIHMLSDHFITGHESQFPLPRDSWSVKSTPNPFTVGSRMRTYQEAGVEVIIFIIIQGQRAAAAATSPHQCLASETRRLQ